MMDVTASEVEAFDAEAIIFGGFVLLDVTARLERREQSKDVVLMQLEALGKFRHTEFIDVAKELFEHVERMRDGLDYVVGFIASNHFFNFFSIYAAIRRMSCYIAVCKSVLL
jgi:hypothetical protein